MLNYEHFENVKQVYDDFYKFLLVKHGMYPVKDTGIGYWGVSVSDEVYQIFDKMNLSSYNHFLDLGSGDGKVVMIASLFTQSTGIEFDPWLHHVALDVKDKLFHVPKTSRARFLNGDFHNHDLSAYDVLFLNPDQKSSLLDNKIKNEFNGKLIAYGPYNHPENFNQEETFDVSGTPVTIYNLEK